MDVQDIAPARVICCAAVDELRFIPIDQSQGPDTRELCRFNGKITRRVEQAAVGNELIVI